MKSYLFTKTREEAITRFRICQAVETDEPEGISKTASYHHELQQSGWHWIGSGNNES